MKKKIFQLTLLVLLTQLFWYCANVGMPTGGTKDEIPPVVIRSMPEANALNYTKKTIYIEFDELIQLKDYRSKFVVSPPVNKQPIVEARGNRLMVTFEEDLQPNTTYTLDFADAIVDNNEGNVLENYSFSFATGEYIDSLQVSGNLYDADDLSPSEGVLIFLHNNLNDTAIQKLVPIRMAKTNKQGRFNIRNVSPGNYRIYALDDANRNYLFDQPGEAMAWSDIIVEPGFEYREFADTIRIDSLETDSIHYYEELVYTPDSIQLFKFQHDYKKQYLMSEERKERAKLTYYFNRPLEEDAKLVLTGQEQLQNVFLMDRSVKNDTVSFWLRDSTYYNQDSLSISLSYIMRDSLDNPYTKTDTIAMYFFEVKEKKKKRKKDDEPEPLPTIKLRNVKNKLDVFGQFHFSLPAPAVAFDTNAIKLYNHKDTIPEEETFEFIHNQQSILNYTIKNDWEPGVKYEMIIDSAAIQDIYGLMNDSTNLQFTVKPLDSYGKLFVNIVNPEDNWLVQILNRKEEIVQQTYIRNKSGKIGFRYLNPGDYMLRIVVDENMNGQWDSGNYYERIQPESLMYYPQKITVRKNWEIDAETWDPALFNTDEFSKQFRKPKKKEE
ncbi:Ig-like domain-containing protein [Carboxylicivirga sediminis]|uniref:Ig-like domain-containing protein n=1 Tax=Carboxylicivirga sediminis TaxID=2006564 RepID=A0A941IX71_9BACT|nr:Ig-like domain-containing protein [Carboxylicivirga sediminis]MBR8534357.1 Ig-like domain-containing protein [Carboxylicivirga sediminis]